jgi:aminoglycoside phosphotransferase (APT) family kinase protein
MDDGVEQRTLADRFREWLEGRVGGSVVLGELESPTLGGLSNETLLTEADWGDGPRGLVLRLAPRGTPIFPDYDLGKQVAVLRALATGSDVPVPEVLWDETDADVLGRPFYVMARVDGRIPPDNPGYHFEGWVKELHPQEQRGLHDKSIDMMALINRVDVDAAGLGFLDRPEHGDDPIAQEVGAWRAYLDWAADGEHLEHVEDAFAWCVEHRPESAERALVWGDARLGNLIYGDDLAPRCVLDWEMAVLGPAELDLGWYLFLDRTALQFTERLAGFPEREGTIARYGSRLGRGIREVDWYEAWGGVRAACIQVRLGLVFYELGVFPDLSWRAQNPVTKALRGLLSS